MFSIENQFQCMPKYNEFSVWFEFNGNHAFMCIDKASGAPIGYLDYIYSTVTATKDQETRTQILSEFEKFKHRIEYWGRDLDSVCNDLTDSNMTYPDIIYSYILSAAILVRARSSGVDPDECYPRLKAVFEFLDSTDFYHSPASTQYHDAHDKGLCKHHLNVYKKMLDLWMIPQFRLIPYHSLAIVSLMHDWCKINCYEMYTKNVKNDVTGVWEKQPAYRTRQTRYTSLGHGVSSMVLASKFVRLTDEELNAIRWHMGHWRVHEDEVNELQYANENFPLVHMLQFADQLSIVNY